VIQRADRTARMSEAVRQAESAAGRVQPWEIYLHYSALDLYRELYDTDAAFVNLDMWAKVEALKQKARASAGTATAAPAMNVLRDIIAA
jgi:hypothetical protein